MVKDNEVKLFNFFKFYIVILVFLSIDANFLILNDGTNIIPVQTITLDGIRDQIIYKIADVNNKKI
jgi:hypothetical protein